MKRSSVFVVDDEPQIGALLTRMLQREGYAVRAFVTGEDAIAAVAAEAPDVLVTDLLMPGMSGLDLIRAVRKRSPATATVLTTGYASNDDLVEALRAGADDFLAKPFDLGAIRAVVAGVLARDRGGERVPGTRTGELDLTSVTLARRLRDLSVVESVHALLAGDPSSYELVERAAPTLAAALGTASAALLLGDDAWSVASETPRSPANRTVTATFLDEAARADGARRVDADKFGAGWRPASAGPVAVAALPAREPTDPRAVLVVARAEGAVAFGDEDLRILGVFAGALGDVHRAVRMAERSESAYVASLADVVEATEARCPAFRRHAERVCELSLGLGRRVGLADDDLEVLGIAARLLDLGRVDTPDELLARAGRPTPEEWEHLRRHTERSDELVRPVGRLRQVKPVLRHHHENWDGSGYPAGLRGDAIPYLAAIVRIADTYAALTAPRAWRPALAPRDALREVTGLSGRHFHPQLAASFAAMLSSSEVTA